MFKKLSAEFLGTFWLVFGGCGSAVLAAAFPEVGIGLLGVSFAFGLTVLTMAYTVGGISGGHFNPAVSVGLTAAGKFPASSLVPYIVASNWVTFFLGLVSAAIAAAGIESGVTQIIMLVAATFLLVNACRIIVTLAPLQIAMLLGGAVLTETTFEWKGLGFQLVQYLNARDFVAVQGMVALLAVIVAVTNFIVDVIAALVDPRIRY